MFIPDWLLKKIGSKGDLTEIPRILKQAGLRTVCQGARCPNIGECFSRGTATFLILGDKCSRRCGFCAINPVRPTRSESSHNALSNRPLPIDQSEPERLAKIVFQLRLKYVVITSVTRDDLKDGGAEHFAQTIRVVKKLNPGVLVEVLIPDFSGNLKALNQVVKEKPEVINHNIDTVKRLYPEVRPQANYERSLSIIGAIKETDAGIVAKSGLMLGLGEKKEEVLAALQDLRRVNCQSITLSQYFQPTGRHLSVKKYVSNKEFEFFQKKAESLGFVFVAAGSFVRSSYRAEEGYKKVEDGRR